VVVDAVLIVRKRKKTNVMVALRRTGRDIWVARRSCMRIAMAIMIMIMIMEENGSGCE